MGGGQTSRGGDRISEKLLMGQVREAEALWPTATRQDSVASGCSAGMTLTDAANEPEGRARGEWAKGSEGRGTWPTPKASDGRAKGNGGARNGPGLDQMARAGLLDQGSNSTGGRSHAWRTPHGMPSEDNPRRQGPSGSELGFQVLREERELWGTPTSHERSHSPRSVDHGAQLANQVEREENWPTPNTSDGGLEQPKSESRDVNLATVALKDWPTPQTVDQGTGRDPRLKTDRPDRPAGTPGSYRGDLKDYAAPRGVLNSRWVAQLMGFPPDWCDVPEIGQRPAPSTKEKR